MKLANSQPEDVAIHRCTQSPPQHKSAASRSWTVSLINPLSQKFHHLLINNLQVVHVTFNKTWLTDDRHKRAHTERNQPKISIIFLLHFLSSRSDGDWWCQNKLSLRTRKNGRFFSRLRRLQHFSLCKSLEKIRNNDSMNYHWELFFLFFRRLAKPQRFFISFQLLLLSLGSGGKSLTDSRAPPPTMMVFQFIIIIIIQKPTNFHEKEN